MRNRSRRAWIATFMARLHGSSAEPTPVDLPPLKPRPTTSTTTVRPQRLGIAGLLALAGQPDAFDVLFGNGAMPALATASGRLGLRPGMMVVDDNRPVYTGMVGSYPRIRAVRRSKGR